MPLPLIPIIGGIIAATAAGVGIKKGIDAKDDMDSAKRINEEAQDIAKRAEKKLKSAKNDTSSAIENLGKQKIDILSGSINDFVLSFEKIQNMDLRESEGISELKNFHPGSPDFLKLKEVSMEASKVAVSGISALGSGALLAFGTYNVVMGGLGGLLVTATTGTAIGTLSGVAATNATLAWLGGGALAAGGFGIAGGMAVLGGLVAGPVLAIGGALLAKQAEEAYYDAKANREKANTYAEQINTICSTLGAIQKRASQLQELLINLDSPLIILVKEMESIIQNKGTNWKSYSNVEKSQIFKCAQLAKTCKIVLDTSLLNEAGELMRESEKALKTGYEFLDKFVAE